MKKKKVECFMRQLKKFFENISRKKKFFVLDRKKRNIFFTSYNVNKNKY